MSRIWSVARELEQPHKKHLANQVIAWSRYEKTALLAILMATFTVYGVVAALFFGEPIRKWFGW